MYVVGSKRFRPDQLFKVTNKTSLLFFNIVSLYFNTLFNWYINLTIDGTIYPSHYFPFGAAFVCQAGNFWTLLCRQRDPHDVTFIIFGYFRNRLFSDYEVHPVMVNGNDPLPALSTTLKTESTGALETSLNFYRTTNIRRCIVLFVIVLSSAPRIAKRLPTEAASLSHHLIISSLYSYSVQNTPGATTACVRESLSKGLHIQVLLKSHIATRKVNKLLNIIQSCWIDFKQKHLKGKSRHNYMMT